MSAHPMAELTVPAPPADLPAAPPLRVETVSRYEGLLELEPVWNRLVDDAGIDHPFLSYEWVRTWWECFGSGKQLHVLVVKAGDEPIAIAPLMLCPGRIYGLRVRRLQLISNVHTQRCDFIIGRSGDAAYRAIWDRLAAERALWDVLVLPQIPAGSGTMERIPRLAAGDGIRVAVWRSADSPWLRLSGSWEAYFSGRASKLRSNLRNRLKRLDRVGPVGLEVVGGGPQIGPALEEGFRIEAAAWKGRAGTAIACDPELRSFYGRLATRAGQRGWLRLQFLAVGGRRIAFGYSLCFKKKLYLLKPGYDPAFAAYAPFKLLCYMVLREAFGNDIVAFDFLGAPDPWKLEWTSEACPHFWLFLFGDTPRARALHFVKVRVVPVLRRAYRAFCVLAARLRSRLPVH